jgi:hypothetical protein
MKWLTQMLLKFTCLENLVLIKYLLVKILYCLFEVIID